MSKNSVLPLISIIVPVFKTEQYIHPCVESILNQSFADFEVILVDDGSPDSCPKICDEYAQRDPRIKVIHKENGGLVSARKAGLAQCRGEYIMNVDSDDYIAADLLEKVYGVLKEHPCQAVLYNLVQFFENYASSLKNMLPEGLYKGSNIKTIHSNLITNESGEQVVLYSSCSMCIKKEKYISFQNMVPQGISIGEDLAVTAPLLASCDNVYMLEHDGYFYRCNPTSIMNTFNTKEISQIKLLLEHLSHLLDADYEPRLNIYALTHYFGFIDRAIARFSYREYRKLIKDTYDAELFSRIRKAKCRGGLKTKLLFLLVKYKQFCVLWLIRKIQRSYK